MPAQKGRLKLLLSNFYTFNFHLGFLKEVKCKFDDYSLIGIAYSSMSQGIGHFG